MPAPGPHPIEVILQEVVNAVESGDDARVKELDRRLRRMEREARDKLDGPLDTHWTKAPT